MAVQEPKAKCFYMDVNSTHSLTQFIHYFAKTVVGKLDNPTQPALRKASAFFSSFKPHMEGRHKRNYKFKLADENWNNLDHSLLGMREDKIFSQAALSEGIQMPMPFTIFKDRRFRLHIAALS